jgi:hypothetical protein
MAVPAGRKQCQCSPNCTFTLREGSRWRYYRGHSPVGAAKRSAAPSRESSFIVKSGAIYSASIAALEKERDILASEIDRIESQAVTSEAVARAARDLAEEACAKHGVLCETIKNLKLLMGIVPEEE